MIDLLLVLQLTKLSFEMLNARELIRFDVVQQSPQLLRVVLNRRAFTRTNMECHATSPPHALTCEEQRSPTLKSLESSEESRVNILESMRLINNDELKRYALKKLLCIRYEHFIGGDEHLKLIYLC